MSNATLLLPVLQCQLRRWRRWWRNLPPLRQDRIATFGPVPSVLVFLAAIVAAMVYSSSRSRACARPWCATPNSPS